MPIVSAFFVGLAAIIKFLVSGPMKDLTLTILGVVAAVKAWALAQAALNVIMDMNPFIAIIAAIILVTGLIIKYHKQILDVIEGAWNAVYSFVKGLLDKVVSLFLNWT